MADDIAKVEQEPIKAEELTIVDHILNGDMDKAHEAIQREVVKQVSDSIRTPR